MPPSFESTGAVCSAPNKAKSNKVGRWECCSHLRGSREAKWSDRLNPLSRGQGAFLIRLCNLVRVRIWVQQAQEGGETDH